MPDLVALKTIVDHCYSRLKLDSIEDFPGAHNGLQVERKGSIGHIGAAVDANIETFKRAIALGVDLLIVHHGIFWTPLTRLIGSDYHKIKLLLQHNLGLCSYHLPLDAHPELGNNACLARLLNLQNPNWSFTYQKTPIVPIFQQHSYTHASLKVALQTIFKQPITSLEFGPENLGALAICSGSGSLAVQEMKALGVDTLICGELRQGCFSIAQDQGLNLYACGHYATETFGVKALGEEIAQTYALRFSFIENSCPL